MKLGLFLQASHPPERDIYEGTRWDLEMVKEADQLGYEEAWFGEHFTIKWEPVPAPDLLIAQALMETKRIKLAPGSHILPYHHPVELAHRVAFLDHLAQGRLMMGIGAGAIPTDAELFNVDQASGEGAKQAAEALEIILKLWTEKDPFVFNGDYWKVVKKELQFGGLLGHWLTPYQNPHPPIGISGLSRNSETLKLAGEFGFLPLSFGFNDEVIATHWDSILEGAKRSGKTPNREDWRIGKDVFVAETDEEAMEIANNSTIGRYYREYNIPLFKSFGNLDFFKSSPDMPDEAVTPKYLMENNSFIGSPETVAKKIDKLYDRVGGFGTLLISSYDFVEQKDVWKKSMRLLVEEVVPRLKHNRKQYI